jgi:hypothetical protein
VISNNHHVFVSVVVFGFPVLPHPMCLLALRCVVIFMFQATCRDIICIDSIYCYWGKKKRNYASTMCYATDV